MRLNGMPAPHHNKNKQGFDSFPNFFWLGPQKSASTWAYHCFLEHPEIYVPPYKDNLEGIGGDALQFFTIHYHKGYDWYKQFYEQVDHEKRIGDTTPAYLRSEKACRRISQDVPDAKLIVCLRHPVDRAYSHYWHEKKKSTIDFKFEEVLENYDLYQNWLEPGFYHQHLQRYLKYFSRNQLLILFHDQLEKNNQSFIRNVFRFLEVDEQFKPSVLGKRINEAGYKRDSLYNGFKTSASFLESLGIKKTFEPLKSIPGYDSFKDKVFDRGDYDNGMDDSIREKLIEIFLPEIRELEKLVERNLDHWRE